MKDEQPITPEDEMEMLDFVRQSYRDKVAETVELFIRIKYPQLKELDVTCNGAEVLINYKGDPVLKEEVSKAVNEFITSART